MKLVIGQTELEQIVKDYIQGRGILPHEVDKIEFYDTELDDEVQVYPYCQIQLKDRAIDCTVGEDAPSRIYQVNEPGTSSPAGDSPPEAEGVRSTFFEEQPQHPNDETLYWMYPEGYDPMIASRPASETESWTKDDTKQHQLMRASRVVVRGKPELGRVYMELTTLEEVEYDKSVGETPEAEEPDPPLTAPPMYSSYQAAVEDGWRTLPPNQQISTLDTCWSKDGVRVLQKALIGEK